VTIDQENLSLNTGDAAGDTYFLIERITGTDFDDIIRGRDGSQDRLFGSGGNDELVGRAGNDFLFGGDGADHLDGGSGIDYASYFNADSGVTVDLLDGSLNTGEAEGDTYTSIERFYGSVFDDSFFGTDSDDFIRSFDGADTIQGRGGNDRLFGEIGADTLDGGAGIDRLYGGVDDDILTGGADRDLFYFDADGGNDTIIDFEDGIDRLLFQNGSSANSISDLTIAQDGANALITYAEGTILLLATDVSDLDVSDFRFL
jgi:Ca2+-binding RTX toxin-like protein